MVEVWLQLRCDGGYDVDKKDGVYDSGVEYDGM